MNHDIALIRCHKRPELLYWCLQQFLKAKSQNVTVFAILDYHKGNSPDPEVEKMVYALDIAIRPVYSADAVGDTCSMLAALYWALDEGAERIYNIEEDVLIAPDFFRWHQAAQSLAYPLTIASNAHGVPGVSSDAPPEHVFELANRSNPIGCCFSRRLAELIVAHAVPEYYRDFGTMDRYLAAKFPEYPYKGNVQWDGLMSRIFHRHGFKALYPMKPRAYHCGFYGANRGVNYQYPEESLDAKIKHAGEIIFSNDRLQEMSGGKEDCRAYSLEESTWQNLVLR